jgi:hypothetical protein
MSPADSTIAALSPWEFGISRWQLKNRLHPFSGSGNAATSFTSPRAALL